MTNDSTLFKVINNWSSTLTNAVTDADTTITLDSVVGLPPTGTLTFTDNNEIIHYTAISGNDLTVERGYDGTTAASHSTGQKVEMRYIAAHHNALKDEIISYESSNALIDKHKYVWDGSLIINNGEYTNIVLPPNKEITIPDGYSLTINDGGDFLMFSL